MTATTDEVQARIRRLRDESTTAIEDRDLLAAEARRALIAVWDQGRICRSGCAKALTAWGLEAPPGELTVSAVGQLSYTRLHPGDDQARQQARHHVPGDVYRLLPAVDVWPSRVVEVAIVAGADDYPGAHPYRITVQLVLRIQVTATSQAAAIERAQTLMAERLLKLVDADIALSGLVWTVYDGPDDLMRPADADPEPAPVRLPDAGDDLSAAIEARDTAIASLAHLQRSIRRRAIRALVNGELGGVYQETAEQVQGFLLHLGLDRLPRPHFVTVAADLRLRVHAATADDADRALRDTMRVRPASPRARSWTGSGWPTGDAVLLDDGRWLAGWRQEYELRLRGRVVRSDCGGRGPRPRRPDPDAGRR